MNIEDLYPKKWISPADISRPVTVTISAVSAEEVYNTRERSQEVKAAVSFASAKKRLILNKTQAYTLAHIFGPDTAGWIGKRITLTTGLAPNRQQTIIINAASAPAPASAPTPTEPTPDSEES